VEDPDRDSGLGGRVRTFLGTVPRDLLLWTLTVRDNGLFAATDDSGVWYLFSCRDAVCKREKTRRAGSNRFDLGVLRCFRRRSQYDRSSVQLDGLESRFWIACLEFTAPRFNGHGGYGSAPALSRSAR